MFEYYSNLIFDGNKVWLVNRPSITFLFIIVFIDASSIDIDNIREPISRSVFYGNNIISSAIILTYATFDLHFYPI